MTADDKSNDLLWRLAFINKSSAGLPGCHHLLRLGFCHFLKAVISLPGGMSGFCSICDLVLCHALSGFSCFSSSSCAGAVAVHLIIAGFLYWSSCGAASNWSVHDVHLQKILQSRDATSTTKNFTKLYFYCVLPFALHWRRSWVCFTLFLDCYISNLWTICSLESSQVTRLQSTDSCMHSSIHVYAHKFKAHFTKTFVEKWA